MARVVIMRGISGSGKSTWVKNNAPEGAVICSADDFFVNEDGEYNFDFTKLSEAHNKCFTKFVRSLESYRGDCIVVDNTNTTRAELTPYLAVARMYGVDVEIIRMDCPCPIAAARNVHGVPEGTVGSQYARFERLLPWEPKEKIVSTWTSGPTYNTPGDEIA